MSIEIIDKDDKVAIDIVSVEAAIADLRSTALVCRADIDRLEHMVGKGVISNTTKNMVSSIKSSHGVSDVIADITKVMPKGPHKPDIALARYLKEIVSANDIGFNSAISHLKDSLVELNKLYVPMELKQYSNHEVNSLLDLPIGLTTSSLFKEIYSNIDIPYVLRYLMRSEEELIYRAPVDVLLVRMLDSNYLDTEVVESTSMTYSGTIRDYIEDKLVTLRLIRDMDRSRAVILLSRILDDLNYVYSAKVGLLLYTSITRDRLFLKLLR